MEGLLSANRKLANHRQLTGGYENSGLFQSDSHRKSLRKNFKKGAAKNSSLFT